MPGLFGKKYYAVCAVPQAILLAIALFVVSDGVLIATPAAAASFETRGEDLSEKQDHGIIFDDGPKTFDTPLGQHTDPPLHEKDRDALASDDRSNDERGLVVIGQLPLVEDTIETVNRCSRFDLSTFNNGKSCGPPLSAPCFDWSRCVGGTSIYVYDRKVNEFERRCDFDELKKRRQLLYATYATASAPLNFLPATNKNET